MAWATSSPWRRRVEEFREDFRSLSGQLRPPIGDLSSFSKNSTGGSLSRSTEDTS
jgi:hypothetical protein